MNQGSSQAARFAVFQVKESRSFWYLTSVLFLVFLSGGLVSPVFSVYVQDLGASPFGVGLVMGVYQGTSLLSQYWWGRRSDRMGRRKPLLLFGTISLALSYVLTVLFQDWRWLLAVRVFEGVGFAAYSTGSLALIGDLLEDEQRRGRLMGLYRTFGSLAFGLAAFGSGWLADQLGIRVPLLLAGVCYALAFVVVWRIHETRRERDAITSVAPLATVTPHEAQLEPRAQFALLPFLAMTIIWAFAFGSVVTQWPLYMQTIGYSVTAVGQLWSLAAVGEVVCFLIAGHLADLWGRKRVLLLGIVCMACVFLGYTLSDALLWIVAVQVVRAFAYACFEAPAMLLATELGLRGQRGRLASLYYFATGVGGITGAVVGGAIARNFGYVTMIRGVVCLMLLGAAMAAMLMPRLRSATRPS
jgi:MFS family permease